nr:peptidase inhibitor family I36 protein [Kineosporia babensis]
MAKFGTQSIDLTKGWGEATSCVVVGGTETECFTSNRAADRALQARGLASAERSVSAVPDCASGWLCLFEHANGEGRRLIFRDETWQNLSNYGFVNMVSSYRNRQSDGAGELLDTPSNYYKLEANAYVSYVGSFNDKADKVHP